MIYNNFPIYENEDLENLEDEDFNYIESNLDKRNLERMYAERNIERQERDKAIEERKKFVTAEEIDLEVRKIWKTNAVSNKSKRMSHLDRKQTRRNIFKRIREEEEYNLHIRFLERQRQENN
ncbi:unnamed protein product [Brachionus calyciflorus]|uniref:Uncharacterized protein n=1 Tax=Brachionus calyciflorus TaxID=104777 RepID=A0A814NZJ8_9BILA|nr:unnamed protein product [Brachionus calyciflorus]